MSVYYNEINESAAAWLRELIRCDAIPDGVVDCRPIEVIKANDLHGFTACHFFAGIGVWAIPSMRLIFSSALGNDDDKQIDKEIIHILKTELRRCSLSIDPKIIPNWRQI